MYILNLIKNVLKNIGISLFTYLQIKEVMVIGYDTCQDSLTKGLIVGGFVASLNSKMTRYYSKCTFHHNNKELIDQMILCLSG